ncbi:resolvase [Beijerinckia sp. L45]|uniref:resolvase n=1 Tax=Beijerinckia sp. L45 TaxID=1641855 RepID=UPI00131C3A64|nr:resolvase [Beijerinckia sp. L45]
MSPRQQPSEAAVAAMKARIKERMAAAFPVIRAIQAPGAISLRKIADALTERGIPNIKGGYVWTDEQVKRALEMADD